MAEWTNAFDSKSKVPQNGIGGSNPSFSAKCQRVPQWVGRLHLWKYNKTCIFELKFLHQPHDRRKDSCLYVGCI